ncbi:MAG: zeta toxin family protein [Treponema sp.]|jgi:predicted kinase|nr:zeta toxin family protein [Treponema sp.]
MKLVLLLKAQRRGDLVPVKKQITRGGKSFMQTVWVNPQDAAKMGGSTKAEKPPANGQKYGMHNIEAGDTVSFEWEGTSFTGQAAGRGGKDGLLVLDQGMQYKVPWERVKKVDKPKAAKPKTETPNNTSGKKWVDPVGFNAVEWRRQWDDLRATKDDKGVEYIMNNFGNLKEEIEQHVKETDAKNYELIYSKQLTYQLHRKSGEGPSSVYAKERQKLHDKIEREILAPDKIHSAKPPVGEMPTFMMLGGRGGSGKSWFKNNIYDPNKFVILDADSIKEEIPEYDGWNANQVHEESTDILEKILQKCLEQGLNVVLDATMKSPEKAAEKLAQFIAKGYKTEVHYMHLPKQEAAKRAVMRYRNGKEDGDYQGRYVPVKAVLGMATNEETFDRVKGMVDAWSFRDNNVNRGEPPILISESRKSIKKSLAGIDFYLKKADNVDGGLVMEGNKEMTGEDIERYYSDPDNWEYDCRSYKEDSAKLDSHTEKFMNGLFKEAGVELK